MTECSGERGIPKACEQYRGLPPGGIPPQLIKGTANPESQVYLHYEFSDDAVNVISFNEVYGDISPKIDIQPEPRKNIPPPAFSKYRPDSQVASSSPKIKDLNHWMRLRTAGVEGEPLPNYAVKVKAAMPKLAETGIAVGDMVPIVGPGDKVDPKLAGKYAVIEVTDQMNRQLPYDTYILEGLVAVDKGQDQGYLRVKRIWYATEKVVASPRSGQAPPAHGATIEIEEGGDIENLGWHLVIRGINRFLPADIRGLRLHDGHRVLRIRIRSETKGQLGKSSEVIQLIRR